jgi:hypothetical protein
MNKVFGSIVASAVAGIVMAAPVLAEDAAKSEGAKMACQNNSCKGKAACKGFGNNACKGQNSCKGHGITKAPDAASCKKTGGLWMEMK